MPDHIIFPAETPQGGRLAAVFPDGSLALVGRLSEKLKAGSLLMGTAESCTGGLVAALCTEVPGSSDWFSGAVVAYSNGVKSALLGVPQDVLDRHGAVSEAVVREMVFGVMRALDVQAAVALSGVAGPDGGSPDRPVGTVWMAAGLQTSDLQPLDPQASSLRGPDAQAFGLPVAGIRPVATKVIAERRIFPGDRSEVRASAALYALGMLYGLLSG